MLLATPFPYPFFTIAFWVCVAFDDFMLYSPNGFVMTRHWHFLKLQWNNCFTIWCSYLLLDSVLLLRTQQIDMASATRFRWTQVTWAHVLIRASNHEWIMSSIWLHYGALKRGQTKVPFFFFSEWMLFVCMAWRDNGYMTIAGRIIESLSKKCNCYFINELYLIL